MLPFSATPMSSGATKDAEFAYGSGQVNPSKARNPGLVYNADELSYIQFLCHEGYTGSSLTNIIRSKIDCSKILPGQGQDALNYPTIHLTLNKGNNPTTGVFMRTVTYIGRAASVFSATIKAPPGVTITVNPMSMNFVKKWQKMNFTITVKANPMPSGQIGSGSLVWESSRFVVRSPVVVFSP